MAQGHLGSSNRAIFDHLFLKFAIMVVLLGLRRLLLLAYWDFLFYFLVFVGFKDEIIADFLKLEIGYFLTRLIILGSDDCYFGLAGSFFLFSLDLKTKLSPIS